MAYTLYAAETVTGKVMARLPGVLRSWSRVLGGNGTADVELAPGALTPATRGWWRLVTTEQRMSLLVDWNGILLCAGPFLAPEWDGQKVTLHAYTDPRSILAARKVHDWSTPYPNMVLTYSGVSLGQIAINLVKLATSGSKPGAALPIVIPGGNETSSDPAHTRTYRGYELKDVGVELDNLTKALNGPDIDFQPQWTDATQTAFQWVMRVGTLTQPALYSPVPTTGPSLVFDATQPKAGVQKITLKEDASLLATTQWANGAGNAVSTAMSRSQSSTLTAAGWPLLERQKDYKTVTAQAELDAHTQADQARFASPTAQYKLEVNAALPPVLGSYLLGDVARVRIAGHVWIPDGDITMRIIGMSGDQTQTVKLDMQ